MSDSRPISRRDLFRGRLRGADASPSGEAPHSRSGFPLLRPPGAIEESAFLAGCTCCDACEQACPHGAIVPAPSRLRGAAGTPVIDPKQQPCWLCPDMPCITACPEGVLRHDLPVAMGTARVDPQACLAGQGVFCRTCVGRCPVPHAMNADEGGPPLVDAAVCVGCGVCLHVCPAPINAMLVLPLPNRPAAPTIPSDKEIQP